MPRYKGTNIDLIRQTFQEHGKELEVQLLKKLTPEEAKTYATALTISWIPLETAGKILEAAAHVLYPDNPNRLRQIGIEQARHNLGGVYRAILSIATPTFAIAQSARFWKLHFDTGHGEGVQTGPASGRLTIRQFQDFPPVFVDIVGGYIVGILDFMNYKATYTVDHSDPNARIWDYLWQ